MVEYKSIAMPPKCSSIAIIQMRARQNGASNVIFTLRDEDGSIACVCGALSDLCILFGLCLLLIYSCRIFVSEMSLSFQHVTLFFVPIRR